MSIVTTVIESDYISGASRKIIYVCTDDQGKTYRVGPVFADESYDAEAGKIKIATGLAMRLADAEAEQVIGGE
jgi:hypothetical protein